MRRFFLRNLFINKRIQILILFLLSVLIYYYNFSAISSLTAVPVYKTKCDISAAKYLIQSLCDLYKNPVNNLVVGNMCEDLCNKKNSFEYYKEYRLADCFNEKSSKNLGNAKNDISNLYDEYKVVLVYELINKNVKNMSKKIVLKSRRKFFLSYDVYMDFDFKNKPLSDQLKFLAQHFKTTLETKYGIKLDYDVIEWLKNFNDNKDLTDLLKRDVNKKDLFYYIRLFSTNPTEFDKALRYKDKILLNNLITNLVILMSQDEYLFFRFFQNKPGSLKIYGSCGHFYGVEYAESLKHKVQLMTLSERKQLALKFLKLMHDLDTVYLLADEASLFDKNEKTMDELLAEENPNLKNSNKLAKLKSLPIQMCDMKLDNFGYNENNDLMLIDTDMAHPDFYLFIPKVCIKHDDCHYFDCKSFCDVNSKRCIKSRINNNLQSLCQKIFGNQFKEDGVLTGVESLGSNVHSEIMRRLSVCEMPGFYHDSNVPISANDSHIKAFQILLKDNSLK